MEGGATAEGALNGAWTRRTAFDGRTEKHVCLSVCLSVSLYVRGEEKLRSKKQARASGRAAELNRRADGASGQRNKHGVGGTASGERASLWLEKGGGRSFGLLAIALGQTVSRVRRAGNLPQKRASGNLLLFASWRLPRTKPGLTTFSLEFVSWLEWSLWQHWSAACSGPMLPQPVPTSLRSPFFSPGAVEGPN